MNKVCLFFSILIITSILDLSKATIVSLSFSDGYKSHLDIASRLIELEFNATFYTNSANVAFKEGFLNVFDINWLTENLFEIGGHTIDHTELINQDAPTILEQICRDRATLIANGWFPKSFHYPNGQFNDLTNKVVKECGYNSAIISSFNESSIVYIQNAYQLPMYNAPDNVSFQELVNQTLSSKGWTIFNFHNVPFQYNNPVPRFLNWLKDKHVTNEVKIESVDTVVNGLWIPIPDEYADTLPTPTPDPNAKLKLIVGTSCIGLLTMMVLYVVITTQIKRRTKIKFIC